jgi:polysaccharide biosynthesis protein PslG
MTLFQSARVRLGVTLGLALVFSLFLISNRGTSSGTRPTDLGVSQVQQRSYPSLSYGIQAFLWWNDTTRPRDLELIRQMRFDYVKQIFSWLDIEPDPALPYNWLHADAVVDEVEYRQLKLIARIGEPPSWAILSNPGDATTPPYNLAEFAIFCGDLAARYKGRIAGYQVWNEPNLTREWAGRVPNAEAYAKLLKACYTAIKAADPNAIVISAGLAPTGTLPPEAVPDEKFLSEMYQAGISSYYDVLGIHAPGYKSAPDVPPDDPSLGGNRWQAFRHVEDMRAIMVANGEGYKQIALLEFGWTIDPRDNIVNDTGTSIPNPYRWHAVTEQQQADYLVAAYRYAAEHWRPWMGLMIMIYVPDPGWTENNEEYWWSITTTGYEPFRREAFFQLSLMARYTDDQVVPALTPGRAPYTPFPPRQ